jgi:hypothetical protein
VLVPSADQSLLDLVVEGGEAALGGVEHASLEALGSNDLLEVVDHLGVLDQNVEEVLPGPLVTALLQYSHDVRSLPYHSHGGWCPARRDGMPDRWRSEARLHLTAPCVVDITACAHLESANNSLFSAHRSRVYA